MDNKSKQTLAKAINYKNYNSNPGKKNKPEKPVEIKLENKAINMKEVKRPISVESQDSIAAVSAQRLQEAVIWSEILDKPLSKRRKRR